MVGSLNSLVPVVSADVWDAGKLAFGEELVRRIRDEVAVDGRGKDEADVRVGNGSVARDSPQGVLGQVADLGLRRKQLLCRQVLEAFERGRVVSDIRSGRRGRVGGAVGRADLTSGELDELVIRSLPSRVGRANRGSRLSARLHDSAPEEFDVGLEVEQGDEDRSGRFTKHSDLVGVTAKRPDVLLDPFQTLLNVSKTEVASVVRGDLVSRGEAQSAKTVVESDEDDGSIGLASRAEDHSGVEGSRRATDEGASVAALSERFLGQG